MRPDDKYKGILNILGGMGSLLVAVISFQDLPVVRFLFFAIGLAYIVSGYLLYRKS